MSSIVTLKITYRGCENKIWREMQISSNSYLNQLGYAILATFDTMAYHLFSVTYRGLTFELPTEDEVPENCLFFVRLSTLQPEVGDRFEMVYDFGCEQVFDIIVTDISAMPKGSGRAYPKIIAGEGLGIIDDMPSDELFEVIQDIDRNGNSTFTYEGKRPDILWDYRKYDIIADNNLIKGEIAEIAEGYSAFEEYLGS